LEWEQFASLKNHGPKQNASLIQIASESRIALFHVACFKGSSTDELMPPSLRAVLEDPNIIKTGVNVVGDSNRMRRFFDVEVKGLMELSHIYRIVKYSEKTPKDVNFKLVSLATQVESILLLPLRKDEVRVSRWASKLNGQQTEYAAADAYAGLQLFLTLEKMRYGMKPRPPRPGFLEEGKPLILGNGTKITRSASKTSASASAKKATSGNIPQEEEENDEFFDAAEELDIEALEEPLPVDQELTYPSLPLQTDDSELADDGRTDIPVSLKNDSSEPTDDKTSAQRPETLLAQSWAQSFLLSSSRQTSQKGSSSRSRASAGASSLRAYHLWHEQGLDIEEVAACCREPPLAHSTVASYIMTVIREERLPFDMDRARAILDVMPSTVQWRYEKLLASRAH